MVPSQRKEGFMDTRARNLSLEEQQRLVEEFMDEGLAPPDARVSARNEQRKLMLARLATKR